MKKILVVAAHPDDEVLGCAGTIARLAKQGNSVYTVILGEGITSRGSVRNSQSHQKDIRKLKKDIYRANGILGTKDIFLYDLPDNRFDTVALLDIIKIIKKIKHKIKPDIIFTHHYRDLNIDHRITFEAVITASRPIKNETVRKILCFEILSSSEWNYPGDFHPNIFFDISKSINKKIEAMKCYDSELREFPHPRSIEGIKLNARYWGMRVGLEYAEVFELIRDISKGSIL